MITLDKKEWEPIWDRIKTEYPKSVWMLSYKLKEVLGFTVRKYRADSSFTLEYEISNQGSTRSPVVICLDFYDDQMEILFRLKYL